MQQGAEEKERPTRWVVRGQDRSPYRPADAAMSPAERRFGWAAAAIIVANAGYWLRDVVPSLGFSKALSSDGTRRADEVTR